MVQGSKIRQVRLQGQRLPRARVWVPKRRKEVMCRNERSPPAGAPEPLFIKMVERPQPAEACGHYGYYYAQLDLLRKRRDHEPSSHRVPQRKTGVKRNCHQEESHRPSPGQWPAEFLQRRFEAQQYKLKVEEQLGLRPSSAERNHDRRQEPRSPGDEPGLRELPSRRHKAKEQTLNTPGWIAVQEYWMQLEDIRQQYHHAVKEIRKKLGSGLEEDSKMSHKTYVVKRRDLPIPQGAPEEDAPEEDAPEEDAPTQGIERDLKQIRLQNMKERELPEHNYKAKRGVKFEINLDECISDENTLKEEEGIVQGMAVLKETLTFEDGVKLRENSCTKERGDDPEEASGKHGRSDAGACTLGAGGGKDLFPQPSISSSPPRLRWPLTPLLAPAGCAASAHPHGPHAHSPQLSPPPSLHPSIPSVGGFACP
ncbi:NIMA related kinase 5 [Phyllostomus discolor]|uniref:non-specific serine/threonine protein kinase n=1 Tax=Phyllostomus discolor TaxID=89673 RepID=A0A833YXQ0_9CHIR|nr:NIMA related kinase 5 [Phyllostomus discolor]